MPANHSREVPIRFPDLMEDFAWECRKNFESIDHKLALLSNGWNKNALDYTSRSLHNLGSVAHSLGFEDAASLAMGAVDFFDAARSRKKCMPEGWRQKGLEIVERFQAIIRRILEGRERACYAVFDEDFQYIKGLNELVAAIPKNDPGKKGGPGAAGPLHEGVPETSFYRHLSIIERNRLAELRAQGKSIRAIAAILGRNHSTLARELKRNALSENAHAYAPESAQEIALSRRKNQ
ncbi:MAG: helix-turn-helix domain-containing protein [Spirochaetia bacterium]|nr:helix-turn-helix domain-containing protein [Spirochaetia bacterium]